MTSNNKAANFIGITKITIANIGLDKATLLAIVEKSKGKVRPICRIVGQTVKKTDKFTARQNNNTGELEKTPYTVFNGLFSATNYVDGQEYRSGNLILPNVCSGTLEGLLGSALANSKESDKGVAVVFGYEIMVKGDPDSATGYVFAMTSLIQGQDPLAEMLAKLPPIPSTKLLA